MKHITNLISLFPGVQNSRGVDLFSKRKNITISGAGNYSAKVFTFAQINNLSKEDTLTLFAEHYQAVLNTRNATDHQNIRQFMAHGWPGVVFEGQALLAK